MGNLEAAPLWQRDARTAQSNFGAGGMALGWVDQQSSSLEHPVEWSSRHCTESTDCQPCGHQRM